jgi:hypothetical protein
VNERTAKDAARQSGEIPTSTSRGTLCANAAGLVVRLVEKITLTSGAKRGEMAATLHGELNTILESTAKRAQKNNSDTRG